MYQLLAFSAPFSNPFDLNWLWVFSLKNVTLDFRGIEYVLAKKRGKLNLSTLSNF